MLGSYWAGILKGVSIKADAEGGMRRPASRRGEETKKAAPESDAAMYLGNL